MDYIAEKSRLLLLDGDSKAALQMAKKAMQDNVDAGSSIIYSIIRCYIAMGEIKDADEQLEFMKATHTDIDKTVVCRNMNKCHCQELVFRCFIISQL